MKVSKPIRLFVLIGLWVMAFATLCQHREMRRANSVSGVLETTMQDLNHHGRVPMVGYTGGMINNVWQTATGHADTLGCGGQTEVLYARLQGVPGWRFERRYEYGFKSPILLPHQWVTGYGPNGEMVDLDTWSGYMETYQ